MAGLGIQFGLDSQHPPSAHHTLHRSSRMGRTKSMPAFQLQPHSELDHESQVLISPQRVKFVIPDPRPPSLKTVQDRHETADSHTYVPNGQQTYQSLTHHPINDYGKALPGHFDLPQTHITGTPHLQFHPTDSVSKPRESQDLLSHPKTMPQLKTQPTNTSPANFNLVGPGTLFMRRLESAKERLTQQQEHTRSQALRQAKSVDGLYDGYLGAGMLAAAMRPHQAPPSLDLLRAIALRENSPDLNHLRSNELSPFTPPSSTFQPRPPNSPSRLPAFLQNRQQPPSRDGSAHLGAAQYPLASVPHSPLNPRRLEAIPQPMRSPGPNLPTDRNTFERVNSKVVPMPSSNHRPMRSLHDLASLYNRDQSHQHQSQPHYTKSRTCEQPRGDDDSGSLQLHSNPLCSLGEFKPPSRSWKNENLFDCPDLTCSPITSHFENQTYEHQGSGRDHHKRSKSAGHALERSSSIIEDESKVWIQPNHQPRNQSTTRHRRSNQNAEPADSHALRRSRSEGTTLNMSCSLARKSTLMSIGSSSVKRSRDLSRLLAPSERNMNGGEENDVDRRSQRGSRPSTACSNYPYEHDRNLQKVPPATEVDSVTLEGARPSRKARVELDLLLESSLIVEGGNLTGRIEVKVPECDEGLRKKTNSGPVWLGEPKIRVIGFEELSTSDARHVFYHYPVRIPTQKDPKKPKSSSNLLAIVDEPADEEGFRPGRGGVHVYPFQIRLPVGEGAKGTWKGKQGTVRYIVIGSIKLKSSSGGDRSIAHFYRHIEVYPYFDPTIALAPSPQPLRMTTSKGLFMGGLGKVDLTAKLHRSTWVAGQLCHVQVHVSNDCNKKVKTLALALIRTTTVFRTKASDSDSEEQPGSESPTKHPDFCSTQTTKKKIAESVLTMGKKGHQGLVTAKGLWMGVDTGEEVGFSHFLMIPPESLSITRGKRLEVTYTIKVSVGGSLSSDVSVDVPIKVINFLSIDPPPGHLAHSREALPRAPNSTHSLAMTQEESNQQSNTYIPISGVGYGQARTGGPQPQAHETSDQDELQLFLGSSRFPEEGLPQTFDHQILDEPKMRQSSRLDFPRNPCAAGGHVRPSDIRSKEPVQPRVSKDSHQRSKSIQRDDEISHFYPSFEDQRPAQKYHHAATHSLPPHLDPSPVTSTTGSIGLLNHFPLPPPSRAAFEAERYERRPLPDPQVSSHTRGASKTRIVVNSHATSSSSPHRQHPPHSTSVALSQVDSRDSSTHSHAMIHMVSSSSNDSAFSSTSPQQAFSMGTHQHARGVKAGSSKTYNNSDPYHTQKIESSYAV